MNATTFGESVPDTDSTAGSEHPGRVPPEERGRLTVDDRVVEKVAGYAVTFTKHSTSTVVASTPRRPHADRPRRHRDTASRAVIVLRRPTLRPIRRGVTFIEREDGSTRLGAPRFIPTR